MILSADELSLACLAITVGATLQATTGLGAGLVSVPLIALIRPDLIPGSILLASLTLSSLMAIRGRRNINFSRIHFVSLGLCAGAVAGAFAVSKLQLQCLGILFGFLILGAVGVSLKAIQIAPSRTNTLLAGSLSAFMGTTGGMGSCILGLLYQYEDGKTLRSTLGFLQCCATIVILVTLFVFDKFNHQEAALGLQLVPGFVLGYVISRKLTTLLNQRICRAAVLAISTLGAGTLILRGIL